MGQKYLHFTDLEGAKAINASGELWQSSYGPSGAVFATVVGSAFVPGVQMSNLGRARTRNVVIVFETKYLPDYAVSEEVMWHLPQLPIEIVKLATPSVAKKMLTDSIPEDPATDLLQIPLHPAFNNFGDWTRMPEDFDAWTPGKDNEKYLAARELFLETNDVDGIKQLWNNHDVDKPTSESALCSLIDNILSEILK